jgi:Family of unknown function (DUF5906)
MEHKEKARVLSAGGRSQIRTVTFPDPSLGLPAVQLSSGAVVSSSTIAAESCDPEHLPGLLPLCLRYNSGRLAYTLASPYSNSNTKFVHTSEAQALADWASFEKQLRAQPRHYFSPRNKWRLGRHPAMHDCVLLFADEAFWVGDKQGENVLKALITEPTPTIARKGKDLLTVKNCLRTMMASENEWIVPAVHLDDRWPYPAVQPQSRGVEKESSRNARRTDLAYHQSVTPLRNRDER